MASKAGRIASRPRWRAAPRAMLRCLGLSALIACAGCSLAYDEPEGLRACIDNATGRRIVYQSGQRLAGIGWTMISDLSGIKHTFQGNYSLSCGPASGTETRQGEDGNRLRAQHDSAGPQDIAHPPSEPPQ